MITGTLPDICHPKAMAGYLSYRNYSDSLLNTPNLIFFKLVIYGVQLTKYT